jgi:nicotinamidase-related amidase
MLGKQIILLDVDQWPNAAFGVSLPIRPETTALGVIDVQRYAVDSKSDAAGVVRGSHARLQEEFVRRAEAMVENIETLLTAFRHAGDRSFCARHGMLSSDGGDTVARRRSREDIAHSATGGSARMGIPESYSRSGGWSRWRPSLDELIPRIEGLS